MGFGGVSVWQLLIVLVIVVLLFGTKKLGKIGEDMGSAIKGFKKAMNNDKAKAEEDADKQLDVKAESTSAATSSEKAEQSPKDRV